MDALQGKLTIMKIIYGIWYTIYKLLIGSLKESEQSGTMFIKDSRELNDNHAS